MRLSNKQYTVLVRLGIALVLMAVLAIDRAPSAYQPWVLAFAAVGGVIGFFPLFTSKTFQSSDEDYERAADASSDRRQKDERSGTEIAYTIAYDALTERAQKAVPLHEGHALWVDLGNYELPSDLEHVQFRLDSYVKDAYSLMRANLAGTYPMLESRSTLASMASAMESINQRAVRVREMHDLVPCPCD